VLHSAEHALELINASVALVVLYFGAMPSESRRFRSRGSQSASSWSTQSRLLQSSCLQSWGCSA
jgi:hypothetical protein